VITFLLGLRFFVLLALLAVASLVVWSAWTKTSTD
jgi:hypothetical protein